MDYEENVCKIRLPAIHICAEGYYIPPEHKVSWSQINICLLTFAIGRVILRIVMRSMRSKKDCEEELRCVASVSLHRMWRCVDSTHGPRGVAQLSARAAHCSIE